ncbi:MAG TPA: hypothetical protein VF796_13835 [Humisphaera sp.]
MGTTGSSAGDPPLTDLETRLAAATERLSRAAAALAPKHKGGEWEEYRAAYAAVLPLERAVAAAKGEPYADPVNFPVRWCTGAPMPHLLVNDGRALLAFLVERDDPAWDGTYVTLRSPADGAAEPLALVAFEGCVSAKLGAPNDEVFRGHPLSGRGLDPYTAQEVRNSPWLAELERINSVHHCYDHKRWAGLHHYVFWFHDTTFECVARSFEVELLEASFADVLALACRRLVG